MTVERGRAWGRPGGLPDHGVVARSDAEARRAVEVALRAGGAPPPIGVLGGDLCRTLGGTGDETRLRSDEAVRLPVDLGEVLLDGRLHRFVAHLVARGPWWRGRAWVAMNAQWIGAWNVAPRAHPNDGLLDVLDARVPVSQVPAVRARLRHGAHLPHPAISVERSRATQVRLERPLDVYLDGERVGAFRDLSVRLEPDALTIVV